MRRTVANIRHENPASGFIHTNITNDSTFQAQCCTQSRGQGFQLSSSCFVFLNVYDN